MKKLLSSVALAAGLTCGAVPASAAIVATLSSAATHYNVGDFITVDLAISGLGTEILSAYDLNLFFGNNVLSAGSVTQFLGQFGGFSNTSTSAASMPTTWKCSCRLVWVATTLRVRSPTTSGS